MAIITTSITARDRELLTMPSIASQMPAKFDNGAYWDEFVCECKGCRRTIHPGNVRGSVVRQNSKMFSVEASGVCRDCKLLTRFVYRLHDNMTITGPREGGWVTWKAHSQYSFLERILNFFK